MYFATSTFATLSFLAMTISGAPAITESTSARLQGLDRRASLAATGHAKLYGPPNGKGGEIYLDVATLPDSQDTPCTMGVSLPMKQASCSCRVIPHPISNIIECDSKLVHDTSVPVPWDVQAASIVWTGSYIFSSSGLRLYPKLQSCEPNCNGVRFTD